MTEFYLQDLQLFGCMGNARQDPVGCLSKLWKPHQKGGVLWFRRFAADMLLVGDLKIAKIIPICKEGPSTTARWRPSFSKIVAHPEIEYKGFCSAMDQFGLRSGDSLWGPCGTSEFNYNDPKLTRIIAQLTEFFKRVGQPQSNQRCNRRCKSNQQGDYGTYAWHSERSSKIASLMHS